MSQGDKPLFWDSEALDLTDQINTEIWATSPHLQNGLDRSNHGREGDVGAAQALVGPTALPWVPDLVGQNWRSPGGVLVFGSAYADFFSSWARRGRRMPIELYQGVSWPDFQQSFLRHVVQGDSNYYGPVQELLQAAGLSLRQVVITDLCRASFVALKDGASVSKETVLVTNADNFNRYVAANAGWHLRRIEESSASVIIALGKLAARGLVHLFSSAGWCGRGVRAGARQDDSTWVKTAGPSRSRLAVRSPRGRRVVVLQVPHPGARQQAPVDAVGDLRDLLGLAATAEPVAQRHPAPRRPAPARRRARVPLAPAPTAVPGADRDELWRQVFKPAKPLPAADLLARHSDAERLTRCLTLTPTATRVVAIANALYNPCRPAHLGTGPAATEEAWRILLERKDTAYSRSGTKWARLVAALEPIPEWAAERLGMMSIKELGAVSSALISGPYRET